VEQAMITRQHLTRHRGERGTSTSLQLLLLLLLLLVVRVLLRRSYIGRWRDSIASVDTEVTLKVTQPSSARDLSQDISVVPRRAAPRGHFVPCRSHCASLCRARASAIISAPREL